MDVSVVIPTIGRAELRRAVESAARQSAVPREIIVVDDGATPLPESPWVRAPCPVTVVRTEGRRGGGAARNLGIAQSRGELVALLDDDDWWHPDKLSEQTRLYQQHQSSSSLPTVVSCRQYELTAAGQALSVTPRRLIESGESIAGYLFERRRVMPGETGMSSSTILASRELFTEVPFDPSLPRHQDWDWLLRAEMAHAVAVMHGAPLVTHTRQPIGCSISTGGTWRTSLDWVTANASHLSARRQADITLTVTAAIAIHGGEWSAARSLCRRSWRLGAAPAAWLGFAGDCALTFLRQARDRRPSDQSRG